MAAGLDIDQPDTFIYRQSYIPAHSEMTWILDCFTGFGEMSRMTEFKDKSARVDHDRVTMGLFNYPVLMAADILLYGAKYIPVGEDQRQHVEFTRDIALRLNSQFGELLVVPADNKTQTEFAGRTEPIRIRSLRNPEKKMSKSVDDPAGTIMLSDDPDEAAEKIKAATTDSLNRLPSNEKERKEQPGVTNLMLIKALLTGNLNLPERNSQGYSFLKDEVAKDVRRFLVDFQTKLADVDEAKIMDKLKQDEAAMSKIADATLLKVQQAVGLRPKS